MTTLAQPPVGGGQLYGTELVAVPTTVPTVNTAASPREHLPQGGGHPFYERLNQILKAAGFDGSSSSCGRQSMHEWADRAWRPAGMSGCCSSGISKALTRSGRLRGGRPTL